MNAMEKKMNLISMLFLFMCVVGFDHFYRGVMKNNHKTPLDIKDSVQLSSPNYLPVTNNENLLSKYNKKIAKLR